MKRNLIKMSLTAAMLIGSGAYASQIVGATPSDSVTDNVQFGFDGFNLDNVTVNMVTGDDNDPITGTFDPDTGAYPIMALGDSYESSVFDRSDDKSDPSTRLGYVTQKIWPISEPTGIKVINDDTATAADKPNNCIMGSSYLADNYLDNSNPKPALCSSPAGSSKRFQLVLNENMVAGKQPGDMGNYVDLVFNIDPASSGDHRYQVFQKISNFTGMRLDGFTLQVLDENDATNADLNISLGLGENLAHDGSFDPNDPNLWPDYEMAFYPPGLWGDGTKEHLPIGWFDVLPSGYEVTGHGTDTITSGAPLTGNYVKLFGNWQPEKWVPLGMHEVIDPLAEPELIAYWGTTPNETFDDAPNWHYGMDHDLSDGDQSWAIPTEDELNMWAANPEKFVIDDIEDIPNVSLNYIVNVGGTIANKFIIRITPLISVDQTAPSYIEDDNITYIPPTAGQVKPTADAGPDLTVQVNQSVTITGTGTDIDGTIASYEWKYGTTVVATTASFDFTPDTVGTATLTLTVTDNDGLKGDDSMSLTVTAVDDTIPPSSGGGGGCTYNPNSNSFDMSFLMMIALGSLYAFRRRFIK